MRCAAYGSLQEITNHCANFARARQYMTDFPAKRPNAPYQVRSSPIKLGHESTLSCSIAG
jgi:hypothetical protein